jgi:hypothetical protein
MNFDLRNYGQPSPPFLVILNDRIVRKVVAFDTDAGTVERLAGVDSLIVLAQIGESHRGQYGDFRGLATVTERGTVQVYAEVETQDALDALAGRYR